MRIIAVDDEKIALDGLICAIKLAVPQAEVYGFRRVDEVISFAKKNRCDIAFLDIEMREITGIQLAEQLKKDNVNLNVIFTTGYMEYLKDAFYMHASGYISKPVTEEKVRHEMSELRYPILEEQKLLKVQCFGNFEVFADGKPLKFCRSKTKELFALLVDRHGAALNTEQVCAVLWENDSAAIRNQVRNLIVDLRSALAEVGAESVFIHHRNSFACVPDLLDCDYFKYRFSTDWNDFPHPSEYMAQYSWAETRLAEIVRKCVL